MKYDVIALILAAAKEFGSKTAISQGKKSYTYAELSAGIINISNNLVARGVKPGDRFFFSVRPDPDGIMLALGIVASGGVLVFADPGMAPELFQARLELCKPRYAAVESLLYLASTRPATWVASKKGWAVPDYRNMPVEGHFYSGFRLPGVPQQAESVVSLLRNQPSPVLPETSNPAAESIIAFTSGTTSHPKCVRHSRNSIGSGMHSFIQRCRIDEDSHILTDHFNFGVTAMITGGHWAIPEYSPAKNVSKWLKELTSKEVTHTFLVPADTTLMLNEIEKKGLAGQVSLGTLAMGAAPVLPSLIKRTNKIMPGTKVLAVYGMTEILPIAIVDGADKVNYTEGDLAGFVQPGIVATIHNPGLDGTGELVLSGPGLMLGYLGEDRIKEHHTGDSACFDEAGRLVLRGRLKDMLIRANKNIYPGLYEPSITDIEGIESCVIVGVQDVYGEDIVVLVLVPDNKKESDTETVDRVKSKLPGIVDADAMPDVILCLNQIPVAGRSSKPDRITLRSMASESPEVTAILEERDHG